MGFTTCLISNENVQREEMEGKRRGTWETV